MTPMSTITAITAGPTGTAAEPTRTAVRAKAYCGPAHGQGWTISGEGQIPERVVLAATGGVHDYQLVHDTRLRRPARDHHGNYLYMPAHSARS
jgi:hypothetical protein